MNKIFKCKFCNIYTLEKECKICGAKTEITKPARFKLEDKFGIYRRKYKKDELES